ncbi:hypothetical protein [Enterovibrio coralii]|uniref:hypothetical protein n=1 Tax=Enterovibrio coralii TaxID=294935 RepID=UPI000A7F6A47|nr:hypothetical protein [Enterovibrio coralii]
MFKFFVFGLIGIGVLIGVRYADEIKEYVSEDQIEAISEKVLDSAIDTLEELKG